MKLNGILLLIFSICLLSCDSDDDQNTELPNGGTAISGNVVMLENLLFQDMHVLSPTDQSDVSSTGSYNLNVPTPYAATFVNNSLEEVLLIGYAYPGNPDNDINARSTALGMVMMSPAVYGLSNAGKQVVIDATLNNSSFNELVLLIEEKVAQSEPLFSNNDEQFVSAYVALFSNLANRLANSDDPELPIIFNQSGNTCNFINKGTAYATAVGIYKDNQLIETQLVKGIEIVPSSYSAVINGIIDGPIVSDAQAFTMQGEGEYEFKMDPGRPDQPNGSQEYKVALFENLTAFSLNLIKLAIPVLGSSECGADLRSNLYNMFLDGFNPEPMTISEKIEYATNAAFTNIESLVECASPFIQGNWFTSATQTFNFASTAFGMISTGANSTIFAYQWVQSERASKCYLKTGTVVSSCVDPLEGTWQMISFDGGIAVGNFVTTYFPGCSGIPWYHEAESGTIEFGSNSYHNIWNNTIVSTNIILSGCSIESNGEDSIEYDTEGTFGTYFYDGTNYYMIEGSSGDQILIEFPNPNRIKIFDQVFDRL